ncbi:hypothetical protein [Ornithinibacillus contaminans]|uniref:hypothetical protein n=1 Tax=Ornithinibacillus contaminans TaxID=694055 RepID=UPI00064DA3BC|nr:hypothetical protein [Ornithinibacillus contaminans]
MSRSFERKIIYAACVWQLITGIITTFFYSFYMKGQGKETEGLTYVQARGIQTIFDSIYSFVITYGMFFIVVAILNFLFTKLFMKDNTVQYKLPIAWIVFAVICYFLTDYISLLLCLVAAIVALSKNKAIKRLVI